MRQGIHTRDLSNVREKVRPAVAELVRQFHMLSRKRGELEFDLTAMRAVVNEVISLSDENARLTAEVERRRGSAYVRGMPTHTGRNDGP